MRKFSERPSRKIELNNAKASLQVTGISLFSSIQLPENIWINIFQKTFGLSLSLNIYTQKNLNVNICDWKEARDLSEFAMLLLCLAFREN